MAHVCNAVALSVVAASAVARKRNAGGTGPVSIEAQIGSLRRIAQAAVTASQAIPRLAQLVTELKEASL